MKNLKKTFKQLSFLSLMLLTSSLIADPAVKINLTDTIAGNEVPCMASIFQNALGSDLSSVTLQENVFRSPELAINPADKKNIAILFTTSRTRDTSGTFIRLSTQPTIAFSRDGGKSWSQSFPTNAKCLGGSLQDTVSAGSLSFSPTGSLYFLGQSFGTQTPGPLAENNIVFAQRSDDGGNTWTAPTKIATQDMSPAFNDATGFLFALGDVLADPINNCLVHTAFNTVRNEDFIYGDVYYSRSTDKGATFNGANLVYSLGNDPRWLAEHGNATCFCQNPPTCGSQEGCDAPNVLPLICGGQAQGATLVSVPHKHKDRQTLLIGFLRFYPQPLPNVCYTQFPQDTIADHAVISSCDNGLTWTQEASPLKPYIFATAFDPRTVPTTDTLIIFDGALNTQMAVSPKTGRVYTAWEGGNQNINSNPLISQFYPMIQLAVSADKGKTWSNNVEVSRTPVVGNVPANPTDAQLLSAAPSQSFNPNIVVLPNGHLGVIYTDFRKFTAIPAQDSTLNDATASIWLDVYKETSSLTGGSTGVGLDFVEEIHIADFNSAIGFGYGAVPSDYPRNPLQGVGANNGIAALGCKFVTAYSLTNQGDQPGGVNPAQPIFTDLNNVSVDPNNRLNGFFQKIS